MKHRDLLEAVRYETAIGLMQNPDNTVTDAANLPCYTDPSQQLGEGLIQDITREFMVAGKSTDDDHALYIHT